jgi:hypothetical protein
MVKEQAPDNYARLLVPGAMSIDLWLIS